MVLKTNKSLDNAIYIQLPKRHIKTDKETAASNKRMTIKIIKHRHYRGCGWLRNKLVHGAKAIMQIGLKWKESCIKRPG